VKEVWLIAVVLALSITVSRAATDVDPRLKEFAKLKRQQTEELAAKLHIEVPSEAREFFKAAEAADWLVVSNSFERIATTNGPLPGFRNILYVPIHETFGAYAEFHDWDGTMLQKFADGVLHSLPPRSIYFGGSGWGRFIITAVRDVAQAPDIFIVTQNGMADSSYMEYLRQLYGSRIWIPTEEEVQKAFQQYVKERGAADANGVGGVMNITGILTKAIFDHNKADHEFYVQESFVIAWMNPYLEPHGLIMKLNSEPLARLDPAVVTKDWQYWDALTGRLLADRKFLGNESGRQAFAKLRSAIGGIYIYRRLTNDAEAAFKQAIELGPTMPEAPFRLAQLYVEQNRPNDAVAVLEQFRKASKPDPRPDEAIAQIREMKHQTGPAK
jgi:tetratricopeptide (TPR) repeat protein